MGLTGTLNRNRARLTATLLASSALFTAGCANMATTATSTDSFGSEAVISGGVKGGNQPVVGATVQMYGAGLMGVGSPALLYATTITDNNGGFSFVKSANNSTTYPSNGNTYSCGTSTDRQLYIKVTRGNTAGNINGAVNEAAAFLAPVGYCSQVSAATFVNVSEVTTVATIAALAQFINPTTESIGNDGIAEAYQAINKAFNTVPLLVNAFSGLANPSVKIAGSATGAGVAGVTVTATPEYAKLNTIANIISSCVNQSTSTSTSNCSTLFANAVPPASTSTTDQMNATFPVATDTIQATLYMLLNPTDGSTANRTNLYNLQPPAAPFQPTVSAVPTDWTIGINYAAAGNCTTGTATGQFISDPADMNIDANGNIWMANTQNGSSTLAELSPLGVPMNCVVYGGSSRGGGTIDTKGNVWFGDFTSNNIYRYTPSTNTSNTYVTAAPPYAITANGLGDIFFNTTNGNSGAIYKITNGANNTGVVPTLVSNSISAFATHLFPDSSEDIWASSGSSFVNEFQVQSGSATGYNTLQYAVQTPADGLVIDASNRVYVSSLSSGSAISVLQPGNSGYVLAPGYPLQPNVGGTASPVSLVVDSSDNMWIANQAAESNNSFALSEIALSGTALSASGTNGGYQKSSAYLSNPHTLTIDLSGNVWVAGDGNPSSITEFVGSASPLYQPYSVGLVNGRFQTLP